VDPQADAVKVGATMDDEKLMNMIKGSGSGQSGKASPAVTAGNVDGVNGVNGVNGMNGVSESKEKVPASMSRADALESK